MDRAFGVRAGRVRLGFRSERGVDESCVEQCWVVAHHESFEMNELIAQHQSQFSQMIACIGEGQQRFAALTSASELQGKQPPTSFVEGLGQRGGT